MSDADDLRARIETLESPFERFLLQAILAHLNKQQDEHALLIDAAGIHAPSQAQRQLVMTLQRALQGDLSAHARFALTSDMLTDRAFGILARLMARVAEDLMRLADT